MRMADGSSLFYTEVASVHQSDSSSSASEVNEPAPEASEMRHSRRPDHAAASTCVCTLAMVTVVLFVAQEAQRGPTVAPARAADAGLLWQENSTVSSDLELSAGRPVSQARAQDYARQPYCRDTPIWANGFNCRAQGKGAEDGCTELGWTCAGYVKNAWCGGGRALADAWAFGQGVRYPEKSCCSCGGRADAGGSCQRYQCSTPYRPDNLCQCNAECERYRNCCWDYQSFCVSGQALQKGAYVPRDPRLLQPSTAPTYTFYVYRAQTVESFSPALSNVNAASLGGVLWYLHNEIAYKCPRRGTVFSKQDITRILRYKVTYKPPHPLYERGMSFGVFCAYDYAACTGPGNRHGEDWARYGYFLGCEKVGSWPHNGDFFSSAKYYPQNIWYSMPGYCPNEDFSHKSNKCASEEPGGYTGGMNNGGPMPTGRGDSTYTFEEAGEIDIDELVGLTPKWPSHDAFCKQGCKEYVVDWDKGTCGLRWWDKKFSLQRNEERVALADEMFFRKYPERPRNRDLQPPPCDFDIKRFYRDHMPAPP